MGQILEWANTRLAGRNSTGWLDKYTPEQAYRLGVANFLEHILHETGNYRGFGYHEFPGDETRRVYIGPARPLIDVLNEPADKE